MLATADVLTDLSPPALIRAIEENNYVWFDAFAALPVARFTRAPELTRFTTTIVSPMFNGVMRTHLTPEAADDAIASASAAFRADGRPYAFWWVGPATTPSDLGARLQAHGWLPFDVDAPGMALDLAGLNEESTPPPGLRIETVADEPSLRRWAATFTAAYGVPDWAGQSWVEATLALGLDRAPWRQYLAWLDGEPVATAMLVPAAGVAGVTAIATVEAARGRGLGTAITLAPLRDARGLGYRAAVLWSTEMGLPLYRRLGFKPYCAISRYLWRNPDQ